MGKKVTEPYLVDALSFTEAEARIIEEMAPYVSGEFSVVAVAKANYSELFFAEDDINASYWYKVKLAFIVLDENTGSEKKTFTNVLVQAQDFRDAVKRLDAGMKGSMSDYIIVSVAETPIVDVYPYEAPADAKAEFAEE
jgi:hypothetical protein